MGVNFALNCIPLATITDQRKAELLEIVSRITKEDDVYSAYDDLEEFQERVSEAVNALPDIESEHWRTVNYLPIMPGLPYDVVYAGGLSWGEDPSEAYSHFDAINWCPPIIDKLVEWAKADKLDKFPDACGGSIGSS